MRSVTKSINCAEKPRPMKSPRIDTKRRKFGRLKFRRVHAKTSRRQQVAATADGIDLQGDVPNVGVARALLIILGLHVVAIAGIFVHNRYFDGEAAADAGAQAKAAATSSPNSKIGPADHPYVVQPSDTYLKIATGHGVSEEDLRMANANVPLRAGRILRIPPRRIVAVAPPELARRRENAAGTDGQAAAAGALPADAVLIRPAVPRATVVAGAPASTGGYVVQPGDSVWRIANRFGVPQEELMEVNGISDPTKMRAGMTLRIPATD
jgi:LysM repeat protein